MFMIGEFSKIAQVAKSQLRFYDRIGLFQPEHIDHFTSYRYYRATQLPELHRILAMKELGLSLEQIQELVAGNISDEALHGMLVLKKAQLQQELQEQAMRLQHIEARLNLAEQDNEVSPEDVVLKSLPPRIYYSFRDVLPDLRQVRPFLFEIGKLLPNHLPKKKLNHLTVLQHEDGFEMENADVEIGYLLNAEVEGSLPLSDGRTLTMRTLPAVETAACIVRVGGPDKGYACYASLGRWAEANGYQIGGPVQELFIVPPRPDRIHETVTEIQLPVRPREPHSGLLN